MGDDAPEQSLYVQMSQLKEFVEAAMARLDRREQVNAILSGAGQPQIPEPRRPKRDRHGMHVVRGCAVLAAVAGQWLARSRVHRALAGGLIMATATGATLAPDMMAQAPAAQLPASPHHAVAHHHRREAVALPPGMPAARKQRRSGPGETVKPSPSGTPSASPSAEPDPSPTAVPGPAPAPLPTTPAPDPTCTALHPGKHCHGGDAAGDTVRALWGLAGQP